MADYKHITCKEVIARVKRDYNIKHSGWEFDAIEWIADGIEQIGCYPTYMIKPIKKDVCEWRAKIPCQAEAILGVVRDDNVRLSFNSGFAVTDPSHITFLKSGLTSLSNLPLSREWYSLQPNWMRFSFESGEVTVYAQVLPTDEDGFPCIPDDYKVKDALATYIVMILLQRGFTHPTIDYRSAFAMWEKKYPQAQNSLKALTPDRYAQFKRNWVDLIPSISREYDFNML